jgi:hypothetical protein
MSYEFDNTSELSKAVGPRVVYDSGADAGEIEANLPEGFSSVDWTSQVTLTDGRFAAPLVA